MVKPPKIRHSRPLREPVTIDLGPEAVKREETVEENLSEKPASEDIIQEPPLADAPAATEHEMETSREEQPADEAGQAAFEPEPASTGDQPPTPPTGTGRTLAAGLAGGAVVLLLGAGLQYAGIFPRPAVPADPAVENMQAELAALKQQVGAISIPDAPDLDALRNGIDTTGKRVDAVEQAIAELRQSVAGGNAGGQPALDEIQRRLQQLEARIANAADTGANPAALDEIGSRLTKAEGELTSVVQSVAASQATAAETARRLDDVGKRIDSLSEQLANNDADSRLARIAAATTLKSAVDRGGPFRAELDAFAAVAPDSPALSALTPFVETGVPTRAALIAAAPAAASAMVAAADPVPADAGFIDRLVGSARSLISVRPIGAVDGDDAPARVARLETAVNSGDYAAALAEFDALPEGARLAGQAFADQLRARLAAERMVEDALVAAIQSR
jgi:hypothetical protein